MIDKTKAVTYEEAIESNVHTFVRVFNSDDENINAIAAGIIGTISSMFAVDSLTEEDLLVVENDIYKFVRKTLRNELKNILSEDD